MEEEILLELNNTCKGNNNSSYTIIPGEPIKNRTISFVMAKCGKHNESRRFGIRNLFIKGFFECDQCKIERNNNIKRKDFIEKLSTLSTNSLDNKSYDIDGTIFANNQVRVNVTCLEHNNIYSQTVQNIQRDWNGCPVCMSELSAQNLKKDTTHFIQKSTEKHGDRYDYSKSNYDGWEKQVIIICKKHGEFSQRANDHLNGHNCPRCSNSSYSIAEQEITEFIKTFYDGEVINNKKIRSSKDNKLREIDIFIPELNIGFEYNGNYFHSTKFKENDYHYSKSNVLSEEDGIMLFHIYDDQWINNRSVVESMIRHSMKCTENRLFARNLIVKEIPFSIANQFHIDNHLDGNGKKSSKNLGLFDKSSNLLSVISLSKYSRMENTYELDRYSVLLNHTVVGGFSKLLKYFENMNICDNVMTFHNLDLGFNSVYDTVGFELEKITEPSSIFVYNNTIKRVSRYSMQKTSNFIKKNVDPDMIKSMTQLEIAAHLKINVIKNCGNKKYIKRFNKE